MKRLSQRDPKWCQLKLGASSLTVGRYGCTTTSISMLSDYFGHYVSPDQIARHASFYTKDGLILWKNLAFDGFAFDHREYGQNDANIKAALLDPKRAVMLEVNHGAHWVVAVHNLGNGDYIIADPWMGHDCDAKAVYHNITGATYFKKI